jgi:hypothetical protein
MTLEQRLTEIRLTTLGSVVYGALDASEKHVFIFPVPLAKNELGTVGVVFWGDEKAVAESLEALIEYLTLSKGCLPSLREEPAGAVSIGEEAKP